MTEQMSVKLISHTGKWCFKNLLSNSIGKNQNKLLTLFFSVGNLAFPHKIKFSLFLHYI